MDKPSENEKKDFKESFAKWYDRNYKFLLIIPFLFLILSFISLGYTYAKTGDFIKKDISLTGGTSITVNGEPSENFESELKKNFADSSVRRLTDLRTNKVNSFIIETSAKPEEIQPAIEKLLDYELNEKNSNIEFTGSSLSSNFYKQLLTALVISFILMSLVVFLLFRTFIPSIAVISAALSDIIMSLALVNVLGMKISAAGIAAFLMLIGYSVDTDILLTTRALRRKELILNQRIYSAFKTGILMTLTALIAVTPIFFIVSGIPDSFRQIFIILAIGLFADILNTWLTNASLIKWYCEVKKI
ncbi:MAG: protein translocase subunit SecF [Nanoarchaeota archaeon]